MSKTKKPTRETKSSKDIFTEAHNKEKSNRNKEIFIESSHRRSSQSARDHEEEQQTIANMTETVNNLIINENTITKTNEKCDKCGSTNETDQQRKRRLKEYEGFKKTIAIYEQSYNRLITKKKRLEKKLQLMEKICEEQKKENQELIEENNELREQLGDSSDECTSSSE